MTSLKRSIDQPVRSIGRFIGAVAHSTRRPVVLGALLLTTSAVTVAGTANTSPHVTSVTVFGSTLIDEGDSLSLKVVFTDPDIGDGHTVHISWADGEKSKIQVPVGQFTLQTSHAYTDETKGSWIIVSVRDRQSPVGSDQNDNTEKYGEDTSHMPVKVKNVAPKFQRGLQVTKSPRNNRHVTVSGTFTDPAPEDTHTVRVAWGQEANPFVYPDQCTVNGHQFTCQHLYPGSSNGPFTIKLKVADDDGGEATTSAQVEFP